MKVYLAGGIEGVKDPYSWRRHAEKVLFNHDVKIVNPLRGKGLTDEYKSNEIVTRDKTDIRSCDLLLAEFTDTGRPYVGTSMEILYAWEHEIPVVVWGTYKSFWLDYHSVAQFKTLEECLEYIICYWSDVS